MSRGGTGAVVAVMTQGYRPGDGGPAGPSAPSAAARSRRGPPSGGAARSRAAAGHGRWRAASRDPRPVARSGTFGKTSAMRSALGRVMTVSAAATIATSAPSIGASSAEPRRLRDVTRVDVAPQVPLAQPRRRPSTTGRRVVLGRHDVRDAQPDEADPAAPGELGRHRLADELRERVRRLGAGLDGLVDRREGGRDRRTAGRAPSRSTPRRRAASCASTAAWKTL